MEQAVNEGVKRTSRDRILDRYKEQYPEKTYDTDDALYDKIAGDYDDFDEKMGRYKENEDKLAGLFASDPRSASFLGAWAEGKDPVVEFARMFGSEMVESMSDPDRLEALAEANKEYIDRLSKSKELEEEYNSNIEKSLADLEAYQQEKGYSDEELKNALDYIANLSSGYINGKITPDMVEQAILANNRDKDIAQAEHEAEVRGRNAKIMDKIKTEKKSDGVPADLNAGKTDFAPTKPPVDLGVVAESKGGFWDEAIKNSKKK